MTVRDSGFSFEKTRGSINIASQWSHSASTGNGLNKTLTDFQKLISAETVQVVRRMSHFDRTRMIARESETDGKLFGRPPRSFAPDILGDMLHKTHCGMLFVMTSVLPENEAQDFLEPHGLREVCLVPLSNQDDCSDFLEFHLDRKLLDHDRLLLQMLGPVLSRSWRDRSPGVAAALLAKNPFAMAGAQRTSFENILSTSNPAGLTRSEFRLCMLIQEGGLPDKVPDVLKISKSTFRSHLRSIYFKTGVTGQVELVHLLHQSRSDAATQPGRKSM